MAFFKFRMPGQSGNEAQANYGQPATPSVDVMRRRARHRLIGAALLVLVAVVVFPMVFDTQPRPISPDVHIDIPDRDGAKPLAIPAAPGAALEASESLSDKEEVVKPAAVAQSKVALAMPATEQAVTSASAQKESSVKAAVPAKTEAKPETKAEVKTSEAKATDKPEASVTRYIVQVGAFVDESKSKEVRARLEKAGLKTYTHIADTKEGKRVRVRVGPFTSREEAEKTANKIKQLQLQPQVLTL
jgi:DedD protein